MSQDLHSLETEAVELSLAIGQLRRRLRREADTGDLGLSQVGALIRLDQSGWTTPADLARAESMKPQSMSVILSTFEREGLVQRRPHPSDGRQIQVSLTPAGVEASRRRSLAKREWLVAALGRLDPSERRILVEATALLRRLGDA